MSVVDIVLLLVLAGAIVAGATRGFVGSIGSLVGFFAGGAAAFGGASWCARRFGAACCLRGRDLGRMLVLSVVVDPGHPVVRKSL